MEYARGTGTPTLEFEYIVQPEDVDSNGIAIRSNRLELNGGTIRHATTGVDATLDYTEPGQNGNFPDHNLDGSLVPPRAELSGLSLSEATLAPAFDPGITTYTAKVPVSVTVISVTVAVPAGSIIDGIDPADSDLVATGHQVALDQGVDEITVSVTGTGKLPAIYRVAVSRVLSTELPGPTVNLMATNGDNTVILSWDSPAESADIDFHEYRHKKAADAEYPETWTAILESAPDGANQDSFAVPGLTYGVIYTFQVSTTVALLNPAVTAVAGSGIAVPVPDGAVSTETITEQAQWDDSPSIPSG